MTGSITSARFATLGAWTMLVKKKKENINIKPAFKEIGTKV